MLCPGDPVAFSQVKLKFLCVFQSLSYVLMYLAGWPLPSCPLNLHQLSGFFLKAMICCSRASCLFVFLPSVCQSPTELLEGMTNFKKTCPKTQRWEVPMSTVTTRSRSGATKWEWAIPWRGTCVAATRLGWLLWSCSPQAVR